MSNTTPDTRTLLAEAATTAKELVPSLNNPMHWVDFCDVEESGVEEFNLQLRDMQKKLSTIASRLENVTASGEGWACSYAREGLECARGAKGEVDGLLRACEVNPSHHIKRSRELLACFGDPDFPGAPLDPEVRKIYAFEAAARGAARLPLHGQLLGDWVEQIFEVVDITFIEVDNDDAEIDPRSWETLHKAATRLFNGCEDLHFEKNRFKSVNSAKTMISKWRSNREIRLGGEKGRPLIYIPDIDARIHKRRQADLDADEH